MAGSFDDVSHLDRRRLLKAGAGAVGLGLVPLACWADGAADLPARVREAAVAAFGDRPMTPGRVVVDVPPIAENGNSVGISVEVDSPMTEDDHVRQITVFSEKNPRTDVARYTLGPRAGRARVSSRMRMNDSQVVLAVAEMNDGSLWAGTAETVVTLAACVVL